MAQVVECLPSKHGHPQVQTPVPSKKKKKKISGCFLDGQKEQDMEVVLSVPSVLIITPT
jgi:hypothetical protein